MKISDKIKGRKKSHFVKCAQCCGTGMIRNSELGNVRHTCPTCGGSGVRRVLTE